MSSVLHFVVCDVSSGLHFILGGTPPSCTLWFGHVGLVVVLLPAPRGLRRFLHPALCVSWLEILLRPASCYDGLVVLSCPPPCTLSRLDDASPAYRVCQSSALHSVSRVTPARNNIYPTLQDRSRTSSTTPQPFAYRALPSSVSTSVPPPDTLYWTSTTQHFVWNLSTPRTALLYPTRRPHQPSHLCPALSVDSISTLYRLSHSSYIAVTSTE